MTTRRREEFEKWWRNHGEVKFTIPFCDGRDSYMLDDPEDFAWRVWQAASLVKDDCDERIRNREMDVSTGYSKRLLAVEKERDRWCLETSIRKEVHRDDFARSAIMMAALKQIVGLAVEGSPIYELANQAIVDTWGLSPTKHCDHHAAYKATCPDCIKVGRSKARGHDLIDFESIE